jgi:ribosomal peptide maturation radical SAM protein 1
MSAMPSKVALVNMPFGFHVYPSIQLGTLSTLLKTHGHEVKSFYLNLHFAHQIDMEVYNKLCEERFLIGEWLFSHMLFGESKKNKEYAEHFKSHLQNITNTINRPESFLHDVKTQMVPEFLHWALESVNWGDYSVVGFTSTFNQNIASVTLAKLIKEKYPAIKILFGGSNFDSEMGLEYFRVFEWIDYVISGEAEDSLPALMAALESGGPIPQGVIHRVDGDIRLEESQENFNDFKKYGPPDYDDYMDQIREIDPQSPLLENPIILYETARGCWWGEKHHCTFCGLNASTQHSGDEIHRRRVRGVRAEQLRPTVFHRGEEQPHQSANQKSGPRRGKCNPARYRKFQRQPTPGNGQGRAPPPKRVLPEVGPVLRHGSLLEHTDRLPYGDG